MFILEILGCIFKFVVKIIMLPVVLALSLITGFVNFIWEFVKVVPLGLSVLMVLCALFGFIFDGLSSPAIIPGLILGFVFFSVAMAGEMIVAAMMGLINLIAKLLCGGPILQ